ncbi:MAG: hypothetical protein WAR21_14635 [Candidatus Acidiferrales bacterium]
MKNTKIIAMAIVFLLFAGAGRLAAQTGAGPQSAGTTKGRGIVARMTFEGSSSTDGQVLDLNSSTGYNFNKYFGIDVGLPVYFVRGAAPATGSGAAQRTSSSGDLGNVYADVRLSLDNRIAPYSSTFTATAPTGSVNKGRSTGHFTYDWDNRIEHEIFDRVTPYVDAGLANSISDTRFFKRPYITLGHLAHFEAGADVKIWKSLTFTASAYDIVPWGQQRVISRFVRPGATGTGAVRHGRVFEISAQTQGSASLDRDNGYSAGFSFSLTRFLDLSAGYAHSVPLHLDTISFGIGFNLTALFQKPQPKLAAATPPQR